MVVTPQQRKQVVVKSIGDIQRESTVRARPVGQVAKAAALGNSVGEGLSGLSDIWAATRETGNMYWTVAGSRLNWLVIGLLYGFEASREWIVPQNTRSKIGNIPSYVFTGHVLLSTIDIGLDAYRGK